MALFDPNVTLTPAPPRRMARGMRTGIWALTIALAVLLIITFLPTSYVIQRPGPVYNTLGTAPAADGTQVPLISVEGAETFPTEGALDLLTVQVVGNRERTPSWFELATAWFDPSRAVLPIDAVFPEGQTAEQRQEQSAALMVDSQQEATAAALTELGYDVDPRLTVYSFSDDSPSRDLLEQGDVMVSADGTPVDDVEELRAQINEGDGSPIELVVERDGAQRSVSVEPIRTGSGDDAAWVIGIRLMSAYEFPIDVTIQLNNVGGPSAGMMFALGIIDTLTPGQLTGGQTVAGTGTITADGTVGPIGGIRQKMWGAVDAGAQWFLAPEANCEEARGYIPDGLSVFSVADLDDALAVLDAVREDGDVAELPTCSAP